MKIPVYLTGIGVASPFGNTPAAFWNALFSPRRAAGETEFTIAGKTRNVTAYLTGAKEYQRSAQEYFTTLCTRAISQAMSEDGGPFSPQRAYLLIGSGMGAADALLENPNLSLDYPAQIVRMVRSRLNTSLPLQFLSNACCAGAQAIAYGCDLIRSGYCDRVVAGGVEAFSYLVYSGFQRLYSLDPQGCRPFHPERKGIGVGDGAAFFVLSCDKPRRAYGRILGCAVTSDAYHTVAPEPQGKQAHRAIRLALQEAGLSPSSIHAVVAHGTGTRQNDQVEARLLYELFGPVALTAPKGRIGHTGGASGAFNLLAALGILKFQRLPDSTIWRMEDEQPQVSLEHTQQEKAVQNILMNCFAFGGANIAMVCSGAENTEPI